MRSLAYETDRYKGLRSDTFNFDFSKVTGYQAVWGVTKDQDAVYSPAGPILLDVEIVTGSCPSNCNFCYKSNTRAPGKCMSLATLKIILDKLPRVNGVLPVCQVAFGITGIKSNPDFLDMLKLTRGYGIIPNFTCTGVDLEDAWLQEATKMIGAVAVSCYPSDKQLCYHTIQRFQQAELSQVNMHLLFHNDNLPFVYEVLDDVIQGKVSPNAVVLLGLKSKGRGSNLTSLDSVRFGKLAEYAMSHDIPLGFDSCSASRFKKWMMQSNLSQEYKARLDTQIEPCESFGMFSAYISVDGIYYPCSFAEGEGEWKDGISVLDCNDFLTDIWFSDKVNRWREKSLANQRKCLLFEIDK